MYHYLLKKTIITLIVYASISDFRPLQEFSIGICCFLLFKWWSDYRHCTFSYIECKIIRNVKKEQGYIYNFLEPIFDINKYEYRYLIYSIVICLLLINWILFFNIHP